jgi:hypothetical protein
MSWPPLLADLKSDLRVTDTRDDDRLDECLAAAITYVEGVHAGAYDFAGDDDSDPPLPAPGSDIELGTVRLAGRWHTRRRSPDGLIQMGDLGTARVTAYDIDIDRLLKIGRFRGPVIA